MTPAAPAVTATISVAARDGRSSARSSGGLGAKTRSTASSRSLSAERLARIRVIRKEGPGPVPDFALVMVVGCLNAPARGSWVLARATEPVRSRNPAPSTAEERRRSESLVLGSQTFALMDVFQGGTDLGHKMEVKGFLIRGKPDRLNVTSMQMLSDRCEP
jgi:hypothetical protein